jgi:hypothetical protein
MHSYHLAQAYFLGLECTIPGQPNTPENSQRAVWQAGLERAEQWQTRENLLGRSGLET